MQKVSERLLSVREAERMTGRRAGTWRKDIRERRIASVRIGRQVRIPIEEIYSLMERGYSPALPEKASRTRIDAERLDT